MTKSSIQNKCYKKKGVVYKIQEYQLRHVTLSAAGYKINKCLFFNKYLMLKALHILKLLPTIYAQKIMI